MGGKAESMKRLSQRIRQAGELAIAFSGGVDSTFLAAVAARELGDRCLAITAVSPIYPASEQKSAAEMAACAGVRHVIVESDQLTIPGFADNPVERCYLCKRYLFSLIIETAGGYGINIVADGANADDRNDYRPGMKAAKEYGVLSPLLETGFTKREIRECSRRMGLPTAGKPSMACLASRIPYGTEITEHALKAIDSAETGIRVLGFSQVRVRDHGEVARIEVDPSEIDRAVKYKDKIVCEVKKAGFRYVTLDLEGFRSGSMNRT